MPIIVCGINHKTAPIALREKVTFPLDKLGLYLADLLQHEGIDEAVLLSTCNRAEVYVAAPDSNSVVDWFCRQHNISRSELEPAIYTHVDAGAVAHMMKVACGIDSMILGEAQILGQMKAAFSESCMAGTVGPVFNRLFQDIFSVAKDVRTHTAIGACPVSIASATVKQAKKLLSLENSRVLMVGAGQTADLLLRHLTTQPLGQLFIANRSEDNAKTLALKYSAHVADYENLSQLLPNVDLVITATNSMLPIITKKMLVSQQKKLTLFDLSVPRNIAEDVMSFAHIDLYCIDDLKAIIQDNLRGREHAAEKALEVIDAKTLQFKNWLDSFGLAATTIKTYRQQIELLCQAELAKAKLRIERGDDPSAVLAFFAHAFTQKLLHHPSVQLRQAAVAGRFDILEFAQQLFAISTVESDLL